jgi:mannose-6-phosphate isomerase-like protein (cupin superfamily)
MAREIGNPRRIVTVIDEKGTSRVARIDEVEEVEYGTAFPGSRPGELGAGGRMQVWRLWGHDQLPFQLPTDGMAPGIAGNPAPDEVNEALRRSTLPPSSGMRVTMVKFPPSGERPKKFGGHDTVDVIWVIQGRLKQIMEGGDEVILEPGDCIIQCGTSRAYQNLGSEPAIIGAVVMGAERVGPPRPASSTSQAAAANS